MVEQELGGNIVLSNFSLDGREMVVAKKLIGNHAKKIQNQVEYDELKLEMKTHKKGKKVIYELKGFIAINKDEKIYTSEARGDNAFVLIDEVLKKLSEEIR